MAVVLPLHDLVSANDVFQVYDALRRGANPSVRDADDVPAVCAAAAEGNVEILEALFRFGASIEESGPLGHRKLLPLCALVLLLLH